ncbi:MAG TPA: hypothetical protein VGI83_06925 [Gemmatimonadales bacterium]|jgi:hypothetical protein
MALVNPNPEVRIRKFAVGLLALAAVAAASILLTRRRKAIPAPRYRDDSQVDELYAAGL